MEEHSLGPNGALVYCMEYLEQNLDWLLGRLDAVTREKGVRYLLFDFPGQVRACLPAFINGRFNRVVGGSRARAWPGCCRSSGRMPRSLTIMTMAIPTQSTGVFAFIHPSMRPSIYKCRWSCTRTGRRCSAS